MSGVVKNIMRIGRATVFLVGLVVILALVFGVATSAMGANGKPFILGKGNVAMKVSTLVKRGPGPALSLRVGAGQPPLAVNSAGRVANLNADAVDNLDSTDLMTHNSTLKPGETLEGVWAAAAPGTTSNNYPEYAAATIDFRPKLAAALEVSHYVTPATSNSNCPGPGQAAPGHLCVYESYSGSTEFTSITEMGALGAVVYLRSDAPSSNARGTWAVTAP